MTTPPDGPQHQQGPGVPGGRGPHPPPVPRNSVTLPAPLAALPAGAWQWVGGVVAAFAVLTVALGMVVLATLALSGDSSDVAEIDPREGSDAGAVGGFAWLATFAWTGHIGISGSDSSLDGGADMTGPVMLWTVLALVALAVVARLLTLRIPPTSRTQLRAQVGLALLGCLVVLLVVGLVGRISEDEVTLSSLGFWPVVRVLLLVAVALTVGAALAVPKGHRAGAILGGAAAERLAPVTPGLGVASGHLLAWSGIGLVVGLVAAVASDAPFGVVLGYLTSFVPVAATVAHLGSLKASASGQGDLLDLLPVDLDHSLSWSIFSAGTPWYVWLLPLLAVVVIVGLAARLTLLRAPGSSVDPAQLAITGIVTALTWFLVAQVLGVVRLSGSIEAYGEEVGGGASAGPAWWVFLLLGLVGVTVELVHGFVGGQLVQALPRPLLQRLVPHPHGAWAPYLGGLGAPAATTAARGPATPPAPAAAAGEPDIAHEAHEDAPTAVVPHLHDQREGEDPTVVVPHLQEGPGDGDRDVWQGQGAPAAGQEWGQPRPLSRRTKVVGIGVLAAFVLAGLAWIGIDQVGKRFFSAKGVALDYASAVVEGRAEDAVDIGRLNIATRDRALLTDAVYAGAQNRPNAAEVISVTEDDDGQRAVIELEYEQDGQRYTETMTARRAGRTALIFPRWELEGGALPTANISVMAGTVEVNGQSLDLKAIADPQGSTVVPMGTDTGEVPGYTVALPALPGTYSFDVPSTKFAEADPVDVRVSSDGMESYGDSAMLSARPTQDLVDTVNTKIKEKIDACATDYRASAPCPFDAPDLLGESDDNIGDVSITVNSYPTVDVETLAVPVAETETTIAVSGDMPTVTEKGTYREDDFFVDAGDPSESERYISTSGWTVTLKGEEVTVSWTDPYDY